jgi:hypothetical protein
LIVAIGGAGRVAVCRVPQPVAAPTTSRTSSS